MKQESEEPERQMNPSGNPISRRRFLKAAGAATALAFIIPSELFARTKPVKIPELPEIKDWLHRSGIDKKQLEVFDDPLIQIYRIPKRARTMTFEEYRKIFIEPIRISHGKKFVEKYRRELAQAQRDHGVAPEYIASVLGIESTYGKDTGSYEALNALISRYREAKKPDKRTEILHDIRNLLLFAKMQGANPLDYCGSYAGAIGWPQFMPSSLMRHYKHVGRNFDYNDPREAISMVAIYLKNEGWKKGAERELPYRKPLMGYNNSKWYAKVVTEFAGLMRKHWDGTAPKSQKWER
ncbi:MAG: lytic murein transglycosylase [Candidatus Micrarchaeota archaeon]